MLATVLLCALASIGPQDPAPPQSPPSTANGPPEQLMLEELREQAREDISIWEARAKARAALLREATARLENAKAWRDQGEKQVKDGLLGRGTFKVAEMELMELESRRELKAVELTEAQVRVSRLKRRLAMLMRSDRYDMLGSMTGGSSPFLSGAAEERITDLEQQLERLRAEVEQRNPVTKRPAGNAGTR